MPGHAFVGDEATRPSRRRRQVAALHSGPAHAPEAAAAGPARDTRVPRVRHAHPASWVPPFPRLRFLARGETPASGAQRRQVEPVVPHGEAAALLDGEGFDEPRTDGASVVHDRGVARQEASITDREGHQVKGHADHERQTLARLRAKVVPREDGHPGIPGPRVRGIVCTQLGCGRTRDSESGAHCCNFFTNAPSRSPPVDEKRRGGRDVAHPSSDVRLKRSAPPPSAPKARPAGKSGSRRRLRSVDGAIPR